MGTRTS